ncbi:LD-carboxypeptidase [Pseudoalteromonas rubra]|uniref:LD-carboxypeptidase n=1 Tax=Pseudoalteromonas rubra TaxID=43658 RepID=A0A5S3WGI1_9GAMM|nr:S66 peptidase family protein [Pseudoalteromonas rubra]TMP25949.1 LD-carboxypeptidase [Pseudoalteromonas rubra]TMP29794.1 LD-carboxypeptidase [Pseudoalteromonas rubra]
MNEHKKRARIVSPSRSAEILSRETTATAIETLAGLGIHCDFAANYIHREVTTAQLILDKAKDLNDAFADPEITLILSTIGGHNANRTLDHLNWDMIQANPKPLCGYSDITVLLNAIYAITGQITYLGPHFSSFGMQQGLEFTLRHFERALQDDTNYALGVSEFWSDDLWFIDQTSRTFIPNPGPIIVNKGTCEGTILGGNLCSFNLLQGTRYMPDLTGAVLFVEEDNLLGDLTLTEFERNLQSLLSHQGAEHIAGLVVGRFQADSKVDLNDLAELLSSYEQLASCPVVCNLDFGHTTPIFTVPIGGQCKLKALDGKVTINIHTQQNN